MILKLAAFLGFLAQFSTQKLMRARNLKFASNLRKCQNTVEELSTDKIADARLAIQQISELVNVDW